MSQASVKSFYETVIVGGGIVGAGLFRNLCLHQVNTLLIDKKDFSSQTSATSSKMLHGGIRYLENFDFQLVWEALHEKKLWCHLAPHLTAEKYFAFPVFNDSKRPLWQLRIGVFLYDLLSGFKNPKHSMLTAQECLKKYPDLNPNGLTGAGVYSDAIVDDSRLTLEILFDALTRNPQSQMANYTELVDVIYDEASELYQLTLKQDKDIIVFCKHLVFATGPFTDQILSRFKIFSWKPVLLPSKGIHLWLNNDAIKLDGPMVMQTNDNRVIFVIPQKRGILVGTTETTTCAPFFDQKANTTEIDYILDCLRLYFPAAKISKDNILSTFAGIRPLVSEGSDQLGKISREHKIFRPHKDTYVVVGGKYTTFRVMTNDIAREITLKTNRSFNPLLSTTKLIPLALEKLNLPSREQIEFILKNEMPQNFSDLVIRRLSIPGKKHWNFTPSFDDFFIELIPLMQKYLAVSIDEIKNFK
jgi:glycerol-3-phosphate dehydrogenase